MTDPDPIRYIPKLEYAKRQALKIAYVNRADYNKMKYLVKLGWEIKVD